LTSRQLNIYRTRWHLLVTLGLLVLPFVFLLSFSELAHIGTATLFKDLSISFVRISVAYFIAAVLGWVWAVTFYKGKRGEMALPIFDVLQSFPTFAALPLAVYIWGPTNFTVIFFLVLTIIWPIFFSLVSSLKLVKSEWEEAVKIYGLSGKDYLKKFLWPVSVPALITGSVVGLGEGWEALVATEIVAKTRIGLGSFFQSYSANFKITGFGILGLLLLIFCINKIIWLPLLDWSHRTLEE